MRAVARAYRIRVEGGGGGVAQTPLDPRLCSNKRGLKASHSTDVVEELLSFVADVDAL